MSKKYLESDSKFTKLSGDKRDEIFVWLKEDCNFFKDIDLPQDAEIEMAQIDRRVPIINERSLSQYVYIIKKGNAFELINTNLDDTPLPAIPPKDELITEILSEGDVIIDPVYFLMRIRPQQVYHLWNYNVVAGLPWEKKIAPVEIIRINHADFDNQFFSTRILDKKLLKKHMDEFKKGLEKWKSELLEGPAKDMVQFAVSIPKNMELLHLYLTAVGEYAYKKLFWDRVRLCSQLKNKSEATIAMLLYQCFLGEFPLEWWKCYSCGKSYNSGEELIEEKEETTTFVSNKKDKKATRRKQPQILRKPGNFVTSFILKEGMIATMAGFTKKQIKNVLYYKKTERSFQKNDSLCKYLDIEPIKGYSAYKFSLKIPEGMDTEAHGKFLREELSAERLHHACGQQETGKTVIFDYVLGQLKRYLTF